MLIHNIKFKGFVVLPCETEVLTVLFLKIHASCDVTLRHWASNYQVLKASYSFKMLETTQGTTQHLTRMWCDSTSLGERSLCFESIIIIWNSTNDRVSLPRRWGIFVLAMLLPFNILYKMYENDPSYTKLHIPKIMVNLLSPWNGKWIQNKIRKENHSTSHATFQSNIRWYKLDKNDWPAICVVTVILVGGRYWWSDGMALTFTLYVVNGDNSLIVWLWTVGSSIISRRGTFCVCVIPCESTNSFTASNEICQTRHKTWTIRKQPVKLQMLKRW